VLEKVGTPKIRATLAQPVTRVQQAMITMILGLMTADVRHTRFLLDKVAVRFVTFCSDQSTFICFSIFVPYFVYNFTIEKNIFINSCSDF